MLTLYILLACHFTVSMNSMSLIYYMCFTICFDQERNIWVAYNQDILLTLHISTYLHMILFNILLIIVYKFLHINLHMFHSLNYLHVILPFLSPTCRSFLSRQIPLLSFFSLFSVAGFSLRFLYLSFLPHYWHGSLSSGGVAQPSSHQGGRRRNFHQDQEQSRSVGGMLFEPIWSPPHR